MLKLAIKTEAAGVDIRHIDPVVSTASDLIAVRGLPQRDYEPLLADVGGLAMASEVHRKWSETDRRRLFAPPIILGQNMVFYQAADIVGFFSWANLSEEAENGYLERTRKLRPGDWNAGDGSRIWAIDALMPFGGALRMSRICREEFKKIRTDRGWPSNEAKWQRSYGGKRPRKIGTIGSMSR